MEKMGFMGGEKKGTNPKNSFECTSLSLARILVFVSSAITV